VSLSEPSPSPPARPGTGTTLLSWLILLAVAAAVIALVVNAQRSQASPPIAPTDAPVAAPAPTADAPPAGRPGERASRLATFWGVDISWPQCDAVPTLTTGFAIVGVNGGRPFTSNPCLAEQVAFAKKLSGYAAYMNLAAPRGVDPTTYGRQTALDALARARGAGLRVHTMWLDVEVLNHWTDPATNVAVMNGAAAALRAHGVTPGVYTSSPMWQQITGGGHLGMPLWLATSVIDYHDVQPLCRLGLGGQQAMFAQYVASDDGRLLDVDVLCHNAEPDVVRMFTAGRG
jgi:GH25 family lysozyme M1 (1,4-beta-N-acetylmuramidase)